VIILVVTLAKKEKVLVMRFKENSTIFAWFPNLGTGIRNKLIRFSVLMIHYSFSFNLFVKIMMF